LNCMTRCAWGCCGRAVNFGAETREGAGHAPRRIWGKWAILSVLPLLVSACAGTRDASLPVSDPHEGMNRQVLSANQQSCDRYPKPSKRRYRAPA
jgi:hypothetical protein